MTAVNDQALFSLIRNFFKIYLPKQKGYSKHTIKSYRQSVDALFDFVKFKMNVELHEICFDMIDSKMLADFLDSVEERGCSVVTRNHRLDGIRAFYSYAAKMDATVVIHKAEIYKVPKKNRDKPNIIKFMSEAGIKAMLDAPDVSAPNGLRDLFFMILLYDTGARIEELVGIKVRDIHLGVAPTVTVTGKRNKTRSVPLMEKTVEHYRVYMKVYHAGEDAYSERLLFYPSRGNQNKGLHQDTARRFMKAYGRVARENCREVPEKIHPHLFRHSRAMHLYQRGMDLTLVSQWLGHSKVDTTLIYAHADTEKKRLAIKKASDLNSPLNKHLNTERFVVSDEEKLKRLYGLR